MADGLSHFAESGASRMVDVSDKQESKRIARASARIRMKLQTAALVRNGATAKGDVLGVARLAGIMAAKRTADLIPLCHPLPIAAATVDYGWEADDLLRVDATVSVHARTGVEMEALTAATIAALTIYDMCKSVDRTMSIESIRLEEKSGGRSGHYQRQE